MIKELQPTRCLFQKQLFSGQTLMPS